MERNAERAAQVAAQQAQRRFAAKIHGLSQLAVAQRGSGAWLPILDADPGADFPGNVWLLDDGRRMRVRGTDGAVVNFYSRFPILTLAANPAASSGIEVWIDAGSGELRARCENGAVRRYAAINPGASTASSIPGSTTETPKQPDAQVITHRATWAPAWAYAYCSIHGREYNLGRDLPYGDDGRGTHGERRIMIGFDDAAIRAALAGASIRRVELHMTNVSTVRRGGVDIHFGAHNRSAAPNAYTAVRRDAFIGSWPDGGDGADWRRLPNWYGTSFRDNSIKGLTIDQPIDSPSGPGRPSIALLGNGGVMRPGSVRLRITYVK